MIVEASKDSEAGVTASQELLTEMKYDEERVKAGIMLAADGLHAARRAHASSFPGAKRTVIDGPFAETKERIAGYWIWKVEVK